MAENKFEVKEGTLKVVSPEALSQKSEDNFIKASRETIIDVVSELLDETVTHISEEKQNSNSSPRNKGKSKVTYDISKAENKELPVRRSSRIQSKAIKKEEPVKKKRSNKVEDTSKITEVASIGEVIKDEETPLVIQTESVVSDSANIEASKSEDNGRKQKENLTKVQKTPPKRSTRQSEKKEEFNVNDKLKSEKKEDSKVNNKLKSEKKEDSKANDKLKYEKKEDSNANNKLKKEDSKANDRLKSKKEDSKADDKLKSKKEDSKADDKLKSKKEDSNANNKLKKEDSKANDKLKSEKKEDSNANNKLKSEKKENSNVNDKLKSEKKNNTSSRKRKQDSIDSNNEVKSSCENKVSTENIQYKNIIKDNGIAVTKVVRTPLIKSQESAIIESKIESSNSCSKLEEDKTSESGEASETGNIKPVKVKSRWLRSSELEGVLQTETALSSASENAVIEQSNLTEDAIVLNDTEAPNEMKDLKVPDISSQDNSVDDSSNTDTKPIPPVEQIDEKPAYEHIDENIYRFEKKKTKIKKQARRMVCDCTLSEEERERGVLGCKEECLNRLLMIECGNRCPLQNLCSNKKFQNKECIKAEVFKSEGKGWGLRPLEHISVGDFLMEFVGEVLNHKEYKQRARQYAQDQNIHCYFMVLKTDEILDATIKGNFSRFINHSCDPNCETQKWTVGGELRVGVFARRSVSIGEEFTLDYKFQTYGREAQKCLCGSSNCSGLIGGGRRITIDSYGISKPGSRNRKRYDEKKREFEDITLGEEIVKLNKGLRNREGNLELARLMVRADNNAARHQLLDILIKTEEQACLRLFLDYHGLAILWSWMTVVEELDLKTKILKVLRLLPISNKNMLSESKVMSIVEKWVQECDVVKKDFSDRKPSLPDFPSEETATKKLKLSDLSDSETDSSGSQHAMDASENKSPSNTSVNCSSSEINVSNVKNDSIKAESSPNDASSQDEGKMSVDEAKSTYECSVALKKDVSSLGAELLCTWKNLKEAFRIPRLEQQKRRKEDEREAGSVLSRVQVPKIKKQEVEGNQIQVLISGKTSGSSNSNFILNLKT